MTNTDPQKKKGIGCFGIGCIVLLCIAIIVGGGLFTGYYRLANKIRNYTNSEVTHVEVEKSTVGEYEGLVKRMKEFRTASPGVNHRMVLTAHDLNTLIAFAPEWKDARGKIRVQIQNNTVIVEGSLPLGILPLLRDQYLNGSLYLSPSITDKVLKIDVTDIKLKKELDAATVKAIASGLKENLTNRLLGDPVIGPVLTSAETMVVEDNTLVLSSGK